MGRPLSAPQCRRCKNRSQHASNADELARTDLFAQ